MANAITSIANSMTEVGMVKTQKTRARRVSKYLRYERPGRTTRGYCFYTDTNGRRRQRILPGEWDSPESWRAYSDSACATAWTWRLAGGRLCPPPLHPMNAGDADALTVGEVVARFLVHARAYYVKEGAPTG